MTAALKQWKTNISHVDKAILKSIISSLPLPFCLCGCLSRSPSVSASVFLSFNLCICHLFSHWKLQTAMQNWEGHCSSLLDQGDSSTHRTYCRHRQMQKLSWTQHCITSVIAVYVCGCQGGETTSKWIQSLLRVKERTAFDDFVMIFVPEGPSNKCWALFDWHICLILRCHARKLQMKAQTKPTLSEPLIVRVLCVFICCYYPKLWTYAWC